MAFKTLQYTSTGAQGSVSGTVWSPSSGTTFPSNVSISNANTNPTQLNYPEYYNYSSSSTGITGLLGYTNVKVSVSMQDSLGCPASANADLYFTCKLSSASIDTPTVTQTAGTVVYTVTSIGSPAYPRHIYSFTGGTTTGFTVSASSPTDDKCTLNINAGYEFSTTNNGGIAYTIAAEVTDKGVSGGTNSPCIVITPSKTFYIKAPITCTLGASITIN
jgi:hypothetical protein